MGVLEGGWLGGHDLSKCDTALICTDLRVMCCWSNTDNKTGLGLSPLQLPVSVTQSMSAYNIRGTEGELMHNPTRGHDYIFMIKGVLK